MNQIIILISCFTLLFLAIAYVINKILKYMEERKKILNRIFAVTVKNNPLFEGDENFAFKKNQGSLLEKKIISFLKNRPSIEMALRLKLYRAGITGYLGHLIGGALVVGFVIVLGISIIGDFNYTYNIPYALVMAVLIIYFILGFLENKFKHKIMTQLPLAIEIILRGIKAGSSVEKTFLVVIKEVNAPLKQEFARIVQQIEFGISFDEALHQTADRIDLSDFYFFSTSLIIQRKAGGSLSEILDNIITSLNKANEIRNKIKVLSAEAKVTGYILGSLPVFLWFIMMQLNPSYLDFFRHDAFGKKLITLAAVLIGFAAISIRYLIRIKI
ncbi:MAG: type II secretion system F family protein [Janthinobacterium lividum]